ncbi:unnamed protein product [Ectocarpus sp. CCAP 1310/34]|nr:unnamed protein product [Ectocarpus sp. CCAP 1310/34]
MGPEWGTLLAKRMMSTERRPPKEREAEKVRIALAEIPPTLQEVKLKQHKLGGLDPKELSELTRKCHLFGSIDLSGWKGVRLLSFRSLCLAVGGSLQTVDLSRTETTNEMLGVFAARLFCLRTINLTSCRQVTTKGVQYIARGCPNMSVLNLYHCGKVKNGALLALSKHCPRLVSLNVALIGRVTDAGVSALSRGCRSLQALNIAGAKEASVTERGVCCLAQNCPGLHTLNITGCVEVGLAGLHGLIEGVGPALVQEAKTFFGFIPQRSMIDRRIEESHKAIELAAVRAIQPVIEAMLEDRKQELQHAAVVRIQATVRGWIGLKRCAAWGEVKRQRMRDIEISSGKIQARQCALFPRANLAE